jgi:CBS domain-containing protein
MRHPHVPTASEIMVRKLITLRPDMPVSEATTLLLKYKISGAPVVDADGRLQGLLSEFDCLRALSSSEYNLDAHDDLVMVSDLMTDSMHTISPEMDLFAIAHEFVTLRVRRLPVVDGESLLGQVSRRDVLSAEVALQAKLLKQKSYPDYPAGRAPIRNYPKDR